MFSKIALFATISLALSAAAAPHGSESQCNTSGNYCCNAKHQSQSAEGARLLALVGVAVQSVTGEIGANCSPMTVVGLGGGASCSQQPVCCKDNHMNGLVVVGCTPINVSA